MSQNFAFSMLKSTPDQKKSTPPPFVAVVTNMSYVSETECCAYLISDTYSYRANSKISKLQCFLFRINKMAPCHKKKNQCEYQYLLSTG